MRAGQFDTSKCPKSAKQPERAEKDSSALQLIIRTDFVSLVSTGLFLCTGVKQEKAVNFESPLSSIESSIFIISYPNETELKLGNCLISK